MTNKLVVAAIALTTGLSAFSALSAQPVSIMQIQGDAHYSPFVDVVNKQYSSAQTYSVSGIISAIEHKALGRDIPSGFYMQDVIGDKNPNTSDGIFVATSADTLINLQAGDEVSVTGIVKESYGWTQIVAKNLVVNSKGHRVQPSALVAISSDKSLSDTLERYEGMSVSISPQNDLVVSRNFGFDRRVKRNNLAVSLGGINMQPNQHFAPSSQKSFEHAQKIKNNELIIESFSRAPAGIIPWYPSFGKANSKGIYDYIRLGDKLQNIHGVIGYSHTSYRLFVSSVATADNFEHNIPRTQAPTIKDGDFKVATFNVLNYFNSPFGGAKNPKNQNRGAKTAAEFSMQRSKIVNAIVALDADIVGLMEIENNGHGKDSALIDLLTHINEQVPADNQYTFASTNDVFNGTGAITSQVIYRSNKASLINYQVIAMPQQDAPKIGKESGKNFMRNAVTPTFKINGTNELLTISVNHFKSKGSTCWEDVALQNNKDVDHQGSCERFRVSGALHLAQELEKIKGHKLIIGDLNSYALEDPIAVLTNRHHLTDDYKIYAARDTFIGGNAKQGASLHGEHGALVTKSYGYINAIAKYHPNAFGYSFSNVVGTLDYVLASPSLAPHIIDATEWNINSPESTLFEYGTRYTGDMKKHDDVYRSSDHDPVVVSLTFNKPSNNQGGSLGYIYCLILAGLVLRRKHLY